MRRLSLLFIVSLVLQVGCTKSSIQNFSYRPEKPQPATPIEIKYNSDETELEGVDEIRMLVFQFSDDPISVTEVAMERIDRADWRAPITPNTKTNLILLQFQSGKLVDTNVERGYFILIYGADGKPAAGGLAQLANLYFRDGMRFEIERDRNKAYELIKEELKNHPEEHDQNVDLFWTLLLMFDKENGKSIVLDELEAYLNKEQLTLDDRKLAATWYLRLNMREKAEKYSEEILKAEPKGEAAQVKKIQEFANATDVKQQIAFFNSFRKEFPDSKHLNRLATLILRMYLNQQAYGNAEKFVSQLDPNVHSFIYNTLAWELVEKDTMLETAVKLAEKSIEGARRKLTEPVDAEFSYMPEQRVRENQEITLGSVIDTYAYALYKMNRLDEAIPALAEAVKLTQFEQITIVERYAEALMKKNEKKKVYEVLKSAIENGKSSAIIKDLFQTAFLEIKGSQDELQAFWKHVHEIEHKKLKNQIKRKLIKQPLPDFQLTNMNGETVRLSNLKGKVVVIDFWATWCGPCLQSFPAMKTAVEKYKDDDEVRFLFINTWERGGNALQKINDFVNQKGYPFEVLLDVKGEVVRQFEVDGIPTKFFIDKGGNIRFKSVGYSGNEEETVDEVSMIIEMIR